MPILSVKVHSTFIPRVSLTLFFCLFGSICFAGNSRPLTGTINPSSGISSPYRQILFTTTFTDADGYQDIQDAYFLISTSMKAAPVVPVYAPALIKPSRIALNKLPNISPELSNCFYGYYKRSTNQLFLRNSANTAWIGGFSPGSANVIENSQGKLYCSQTVVSGSGTTLTIKWSLALKSTFTGTKDTYLYVKDTAGAYDGWVKKGTWTIRPNSGPTAGVVSPSSGSYFVNAATNFTTTYSDRDSYEDIQYAYFLINASISASRCFYGYYDQSTNKLYLRNDANSASLGGYAPGSVHTIENSYAKLDCARTTISGSGSTLTVTWSITFKSAFLGTQNAYLYVRDYSSASQGWVHGGTLTIQVADTIPPTGSILINDGASYTNSTAVALTLSAQDNAGGSGLSQMRFSNDNSTWSTPENYATTKSWTLTSGDGTKTVYVKFSDVAGNWSVAYQARIVLDTTPPQIISVIPVDGATCYENDVILISPTVSDTDPSPSEYQFSIDGAIRQAWSNLSSYRWIPTSQDKGNHNIKVEVRDIGGQDIREIEVYIFRKPILPP